jgi:hypothetical protein
VGYGSKRLRKGCRDNVGKDLVAAGTGSNLRRLRDRWEDLRTGEGQGLAHELVGAMMEK